jgi:hypothetical protein
LSHFIAGAIKHPGALHEDLGVPMGQKIPQAKINAAAAGKYGEVTARRAAFAKVLARLRPK